jgi:YebC/PmpR family DNA-binding regulatory protein
MAGHSKWANIQHRKNKQDAKRAKLFTKLIREITVSARMGGGDAGSNPRLRSASDAALSNNMTRDTIERATKRGAGGGEGEHVEEIRYEGYAPDGIAIIVEALTDNRNRTASEVRSIFTKMGGALGETGSVGFMFDRVGVIQFSANVGSEDEIFESALEYGASEVESASEIHVIITDPENFISVRDELIKKYKDPISAKLDWKAINVIEINDLSQAQKLLKMIDLLEDCDDVQMVTGNYIFSDEINQKI